MNKEKIECPECGIVDIPKDYELQSVCTELDCDCVVCPNWLECGTTHNAFVVIDVGDKCDICGGEEETEIGRCSNYRFLHHESCCRRKHFPIWEKESTVNIKYTRRNI